jgi:hypothetical protein
MNDGSAMGEVTIETARAAVARMRSRTKEGVKLFDDFYSRNTCWPYELIDGESVAPPDNFSVSTTAMIIHACLVSIGDIRTSVLVPKTGSWRPVSPPPSLRHRLDTSTRRLYAKCGGSNESLTTSTTWGDNDPLTLTWIYEIMKSSRPVKNDELEMRLIEVIRSRIDQAFEHPENVVLSNIANGPRAVPHVFPLLRIVQLRDALKTNKDLGSSITRQSTEVVEDWFSNQLNTQLSLSDIPNSEFDPASLVFALEGLLSIGGHQVNELLVKRTLAVMRENASTGSYWRPVRPIRIDARGLVLLPQSTEVANSLLRICHIGQDRSDSWLPIIVEELFSYTRWLEGRVISGGTKQGKPFTGWQSDHTHADGLIHLWATSQALLYCEHYGAMMQEYLARLLRESAGLEFESLEAGKSWENVSKNEPLSGLPTNSSNRTYTRLSVRFVEPLRSGKPNAATSLLVHGPPGTGKTALAEDLARALDYKMITITMSDFIRTGEAGVEARAKQIFEALNEQYSVVVLFDEIDRLILSRDSPEYGKQSDMFQFMTPSMLTKLNNLRRRGTVLWMISTNYEDRLDGAIKRAGRIDESILLLPPDLKQRELIIEKIVKEFDAKPTQRQIEAIAKKTSLFAYREIEGVCQAGNDRWLVNKGNKGPGVGKLILAAVEDFEPAISVASYETRVSSDRKDPPVKEVLFLAYLVLETGESLEAHRNWLEPVIQQGQQTKGIDEIVRAELAKFLART